LGADLESKVRRVVTPPGVPEIGIRRLPLSEGCFAVDVLVVLPRDGQAKQGFPDKEADITLPFVSTIRFGDWVTTAAGASDFRGDWKSPIHLGELSLVAVDARVNPYIWLGSEIEAQTEWTLVRLDAAAERAGTHLQWCIHADVTLCDPSDYQGFERVWRRWFPVDQIAQGAARS
jgi:enamine deaminase RidA (YjgF/YER057c/UK114 family)